MFDVANYHEIPPHIHQDDHCLKKKKRKKEKKEKKPTSIFEEVEKLEFLCTADRNTREGNGNPLQYSCLENPVDGGAWWAAVHRVAKSWTQLK